MADRWYYSWGGPKQGPFTIEELRSLADAGKIQPGDTVFEDEAVAGVPAGRVKNLFPEYDEENSETAMALPAVATAESEGAPAPAPTSDSGGLPALSGTSDPALPAQKTEKPKPPPEAPKKLGRATAIRGAVITSQDGKRVQFRKKCITCGYEDASKSTIPMRMGTTRLNFFCRKCRKLKPVEINGSA
jgi:hypothetical protein